MGLLRSEDYEQAATLLAQARSEEPESDLVARLLATARFRGGEPRLARPLLEEQVERHPEDPTPRLSLAAVLEELGDYAGAVAHYREVLAGDAGNTEAMAALSGLAARLGRREDALAWMRRAHQAAPDRLALTLKLARLELDSGRLTEAETLYRRILESHPGQRQALGTLAVLLARRGRFDEALELLDRRLELFPDDIKAHYNKAVVLEDAGRLSEAAGAYEVFLERAPPELARETAQARRFLARQTAGGSASRP
jgi:tetratricopeptide (TPR) repeat protein